MKKKIDFFSFFLIFPPFLLVRAALVKLLKFFFIFTTFIIKTRKCPLRGHILAPPEGLRAPGLPGVNPGGRLQGSGGDSKAI